MSNNDGIQARVIYPPQYQEARESFCVFFPDEEELA